MLAACGGPVTVPSAGSPGGHPSTSICAFEGAWRTGIVRAAHAGFELALFDGGDVRAELTAPDRVTLEVRTDGWTMRGFADPGRDRTLRLQAPHRLRVGVALDAGRAVRVLAVRADGDLQIGLSDNGPGRDDGVRWVAEPTGVAACAELGLASPERTPAVARALWAIVGVAPEALQVAVLDGGREVPLSASPGGAPFAHLIGSRRVRVASRRDGHAQIVFDIRGHVITGWAPEPALRGSDARSGFGGLGLRGGVEQRTVCTVDEDLALYASRGDGTPEPVGTMEAGTVFVRMEALERGTLRIRPHPRAHVALANGVVLRVTPTAPATCVEERDAPRPAAMRRALGAGESPRVPPSSAFSIRARVTRSDLPAVATGSECTASLEHRPGEGSYPCRLELRCGALTLYGTRPTNGYFSCMFDDGPPLVVVGRDPESHDPSGDPILRIDTRASSLRVQDDASGENGAYTIEAHIEAVAAHR